MKNENIKNPLIGITVTKPAYKQIKKLIKNNKNVEAIKINIKKSGCAGFKYYLSLIYIGEKNTKKKFYCYKKKNVIIYIEMKNMKFFNGTTIDFITGDGINMNFKFHNPKIKTFCGCGESFNILEKI